MSVVLGIDFGNQNSSVAAVNREGVTVILNEVSSRQTPSVIAFGEKQRFIGDAALIQQLRNIDNTIMDLKRRMSDAKKIEVRFCQKEYSLEIEFAVAMLFKRLKLTAEEHFKVPCRDIVVSVPSYWTHFERNRIINSCKLVDFNCLGLINETTASGLEYGFFKNDEMDNTIMFIDVGNSSTKISVIKFLKNEMQVLSHTFDASLGGYDFDCVLREHFNSQFKEKFGKNLLENPKSKLKLDNACEKMKKILNTINETNINVENIYGEYDLIGKMNIEEYDKKCSHLLDKIEGLIKEALKKSNLKMEGLKGIELTGSGSRLRLIKKRIIEKFGKEPNTSLNCEESVAKGCALYGAILCPNFRTKEYKIWDRTTHGIHFDWLEGNEITEILTPNHKIPCFKYIKLNHHSEVTANFRYNLKGNSLIKKIHINDFKNVTFSEKTEYKINLRIKLDFNGFLTIDNVKLADYSTSKPKHYVLPFVEEDVKNDIDIEHLKTCETSFSIIDKNFKEMIDSKNDLEGYIYNLRNSQSCDCDILNFLDSDSKQTLTKKIAETENWLNTSEELTKDIYQDRLTFLQNFIKPFENRKKNYERLDALINFMISYIGMFQKDLNEESKKRIDKYQQDINNFKQELVKHPRTTDPPLTAEQLLEIKKDVDEEIKKNKK